jgi:hypothetical protein
MRIVFTVFASLSILCGSMFAAGVPAVKPVDKPGVLYQHAAQADGVEAHSLALANRPPGAHLR